MILAEWTVGQAVWAIFWAGLMWSIFIAWILLVLRIFADIVVSDDLSGLGRGSWALLVLVLPLLGVFLYMVVHGASMQERHRR